MRYVVLLATVLAGCSFSVGLGPMPGDTPGGAAGAGAGGADPGAGGGGVATTPDDGGLMVSVPDLAVVAVGAPCTSDAQCGGKQCVRDPPGAPQGFCTVACGDGKPKCPMGTACVDVAGGKFCVACTGPCGK